MAIAPKRVEGFIEIENAPIIYKNFSGRERPPYNPAGYRNFCVVIEDEDFATKLRDDGWNIKVRKPRDEEGEPLLYLPVKISYNIKPPQIILVTHNGKQTHISEDELQVLDEIDIEHADIAVNPYNWSMNGNHGVTAYLKSGYFVMEKVPFADKYSDDYQTPDSEV